VGRRGALEGEGSHLSDHGLCGLRVACFESRRAAEIAELVRRHGGEPVSAPTMREVAIGDNPAAAELARRLVDGTVDIVIFLTGVGTRFFIELSQTAVAGERLTGALQKIVTVARGPKPRAALAELGVRPTIQAPEPNTWRELVAAIDAHGSVAGKNVAVQEYGAENPDLIRALESRGARVLAVPVYRWALPADLAPLEAAIDAVCADTIDVALFTSATQVEHLFRVAGSRAERLRAGLGAAAVGSIGPICSETLRRHAVGVDFEPEHPKMGQLVLAAARHAGAIRARKRTARG
jgi:uroporphyrinogen-III synthase